MIDFLCRYTIPTFYSTRLSNVSRLPVSKLTMTLVLAATLNEAPRFNNEDLLFADAFMGDTIEGRSHVFYSGSVCGKTDSILIEAVNNNADIVYAHRKRAGLPFSRPHGKVIDAQIVRERQVPIGRIPGSRKWVKAAPNEQLLIMLTIEQSDQLYKDRKVPRKFPKNGKASTHLKSDLLFDAGLISQPTRFVGGAFYRRPGLVNPRCEWSIGRSCIYLFAVTIATSAVAAAASAVPLLIENA